MLIETAFKAFLTLSLSVASEEDVFENEFCKSFKSHTNSNPDSVQVPFALIRLTFSPSLSSSFVSKESSVADKWRNANEYFKSSHKDHSQTSIPTQTSTATNEVAASSLNYEQQSINNQSTAPNQSEQPIHADNLNGSNGVSMNSSSHNGHSHNGLSHNGLYANCISLNNSLSINNLSNGHHGPTVTLPEFPNIKELRLRTRSHYSNKHLISLYSTFLMMYRTHCQRILDTLIRCNLSELNTFISYFWQAVPEHLKCVLAEPVFHCLIAICDCILYKCMTQILSAPLLQSNLPEK